ncbi:hypothetical protein D3C73_1101430 [compost metagenome]
MFGYIGKTVPADLILRLLPAGIAVRRTLQRPKRNLIGRFVCNHIDRKSDLQQLVGFVPVHMCFKIDPPVMGIQDQILCDFGLAQLPAESQHIPDFAGMKHVFLHQFRLTGGLGFITAVNIPGIPERRTVMEEVEPVGASAWLHDFTACRFVEQAGDFAPFIEGKAIVRRFPAII